MLASLSIHNFVIIESCHLDFHKGFHVITGETGAGKSLIFRAIHSLLGGPVTEDMILPGKAKASLEAIFDVSHMDLPPFILELIDDNEQQLIVSRSWSPTKRVQNKLNLQSVPLKFLKQVMSHFISIVGQHDHMQLINPSSQIQWVDSYASTPFKIALKTYQDLYKNYHDVVSAISSCLKKHDDIDQKKAFLSFQLSDINSQNFQYNEDIDCETRKLHVKHYDKLYRHNISLKQELNHVSDHLSLAIVELTNLEATYATQSIQSSQSSQSGQSDQTDQSDHSSQSNHSLYKTHSNSVQEIMALVEIELDFAGSELMKLSEYKDMAKGIPSDMSENVTLDHIESRLDIIFNYKTKYKCTCVNDLLDLKTSLEKQLETFETINISLSELEQKRDHLKSQLIKSSEALYQLRQSAINQLEPTIKQNLVELGFENCLFEIRCHHNTQEFYKHGQDIITFYLATNKGHPSHPISKIASGGELSRILLSIKVACNSIDNHHTLLFDEIDTGVGGLIANKIGEKLSFLSQSHQLICITHLAQIAQFSNYHYFVRKSVSNEQSLAHIKIVKDENKIQELQRMIGGKTITNLIRV